jgi:hypothetical protein
LDFTPSIIRKNLISLPPKRKKQLKFDFCGEQNNEVYMRVKKNRQAVNEKCKDLNIEEMLIQRRRSRTTLNGSI